MRDLAGKAAVITGAGSGIGRGTALALAEAGTNIVVADINEETATSVVAEIAALGVRSLAVQTDVTEKRDVDALADAAYAEFGAVHILHNNAGVALFVRLDELTDDDWRFIVNVNLFGVVNGLQVFLPRFKAQDGEKHIVNTASLAGLVAAPSLGAYNATKFAVVAISETLREEAAPFDIGVSVLCPGFVSTNLTENTLQHRPPGGADFDLSGIGGMDPALFTFMPPEEAGQIVRRGIEDNEAYILTHPEWEPFVQTRFDNVLAAFERARSAKTPIA